MSAYEDELWAKVRRLGTERDEMHVLTEAVEIEANLCELDDTFDLINAARRVEMAQLAERATALDIGTDWLDDGCDDHVARGSD